MRLSTEDTVIVKAAARILHEYGAKLCEAYDELGTREGYVGYLAGDTAAEIYDWLRNAEKAGLLPDVAVELSHRARTPQITHPGSGFKRDDGQ